MYTLTNLEGTIRQAVLNVPGSWHDSRVARPVYRKLRDSTPDGYYLVADSAFPQGTGPIEGRIRAALKEGSRLPADPHRREQHLRFNRELVSYRQTVEWGMRAIQGAFGRLRLPLNINQDEERQEILEVCMRLTNVRTAKVGINQIRNVYMPIWTADREDMELWTGFEQMLFGDIRHRDRVARFHLI